MTNVVGKNVSWHSTDGGRKLVIEIDLLANVEPSASGKTLIIASTKGNQKLQLEHGRFPVFLGLNCYRYADK